jgi:hypothetical protein
MTPVADARAHSSPALAACMTAPTPAVPPATPPDPHVGIFWQVPDAAGAPHLVVDTEPLLKAETYGDFLTHPRGHYEVWTRWQRLGPRFLQPRGWPLTILTTEYETHPRGRVVLYVPANTFWIYVDRRLQRRATIAQLKTALGLTRETCVVKSDAHYQ